MSALPSAREPPGESPSRAAKRAPSRPSGSGPSIPEHRFGARPRARPLDGAIRRSPAGQGPGEAARFRPDRTTVEPTTGGLAELMNPRAAGQPKRRKGELRLPAEEGSPLDFAGYHGRNVMVTGGAGFVGPRSSGNSSTPVQTSRCTTTSSTAAARTLTT